MWGWNPGSPVKETEMIPQDHRDRDNRADSYAEPNSCFSDSSDSLNSLNSLNSMKVLLDLEKTPIRPRSGNLLSDLLDSIVFSCSQGKSHLDFRIILNPPLAKVSIIVSTIDAMQKLALLNKAASWEMLWRPDCNCKGIFFCVECSDCIDGWEVSLLQVCFHCITNPIINLAGVKTSSIKMLFFRV